MRSDDDIHEAFRLAEAGLTQAQIAARIGMGQSGVSRWLRAGKESVLGSPMRRRRLGTKCPDQCPVRATAPGPACAYLLGHYLVSGSVAHTGRGVHRLTVTCCGDSPHVHDEVRAAVGQTLRRDVVRAVRRERCTDVTCYSKHWPCLLPPLGSGSQATRPVVLEAWHRALALDRHPDQFVRGLLHSDGCRGPSPMPRYTFSSTSPDIRRLFGEACDRLDVEWRHLNRWTISVVGRTSTARLEEIISSLP